MTQSKSSTNFYFAQLLTPIKLNLRKMNVIVKLPISPQTRMHVTGTQCNPQFAMAKTPSLLLMVSFPSIIRTPMPMTETPQCPSTLQLAMMLVGSLMLITLIPPNGPAPRNVPQSATPLSPV